MNTSNVPGKEPQYTDDLYLAATGKDLSILAAVNWAWKHRWSPVPTDWPVLHNWGRSHGLDTDGLRFVAWVGARRLHFGFAYTLMGKFCADALREYPDDELLTALKYACDLMHSVDSAAWSSLAKAAHAGHAEGIASHIYLTSAHYASDVPDEFLRDALDLACVMAGPDDIVAAYRVVSLMRRVGAYRDAITACDAVNELLLAGAADPVLSDHISERVLAERHLCIELLQTISGDRSRS